MKNKLVIFFLAVFLTSCANVQKKSDINVKSCNSKKLVEQYFLDWEDSLLCAQDLLNEKSSKDSQLALFVLGEAAFLEADDQRSFEFFQEAIYGPDPLVSEASLSYIKKVSLSFDQIETFIKADTGSIKDRSARLSVDLERLKWALSAGTNRISRKILSDISIPGDLKLIRIKKDSLAVSLNDITEFEKRGFSFEATDKEESSLVKGSTVNIDDHFSNVEGSIFYFQGEFYLKESSDLSVFIDTSMDHRIFIDGQLVADDPGTLVFSEGNHNVVIKFIASKEQAGEVTVFIPFYDTGYKDRKDGKTAGSFAFNEKESQGQTLFSRYISLLVDPKASTDKFFKIYSGILGSFPPPFIYNLALTSFDERSIERGFNYLKRIVEIKPLLRPIIEMKNYFLYLGRKKDLATFEKKFPIKKNNLYSRLFELDKLSFEKQLLAGVVTSEKFFKEFSDHPASYYYYSGALEEFGNVKDAIRIRQQLLKKLPFNMPLLKSVGELAEQMGKNSLLEEVIKRKLSNYPQNINFKIKLAKSYFRVGKYKKAERIYDDILSSLSSDLRSLLGKGDIAFAMGEKKKAEKYYLQAFLLYPESIAASKKAALFKSTDHEKYFEKYSLKDEAVRKLALEDNNGSDLPYVIVYDEGNYRIVNHNLVVAKFRVLIRVNDQKGVDEFKETRFSGDLISAEIIRKDGTIVKANKSKTRDNIIDLQSLKIGDTINYVFLTKDRNDHWLKGFNDTWLFGDIGTLYVDSRVSIFVPQGMRFNYSISEGINDPQIKNETGGKVYLFEEKGTSLPSREKNMPQDLYKVIPNLQFSVVNSWKDFAKWQISFIKDGGVVTRYIEEKTFSLIGKDGNKMSILKKIRDFVAQKIKYRSTDPGELGVKPESAQETLKRMSGDCKDRVMLMKTMLKAAGIESRYALIKSKFAGSFIENVPSMQFDHALIFIPPQDGIRTDGFFLDPTSSYDSFLGLNRALLNVKAMVINESEPSYSFIKVKENSIGLAEFTLDVPDSSSAILSGTTATMFRFGLASGKKPHQILAKFLSNKSGESKEIEKVELKGGSLSDPIKLVFSYKGSFPSIQTVYGDLKKSDKRFYPFEAPYLAKKFSFTIKTDKDVNFTEENDFFSYQAKNTGNGVVKVDFVVKKWTIKSEEFAELKKYVINVIVFERKVMEGPNG